MPTLHREAGYVFEMVMFDCRERRHAHMRGNGKGGAKVWFEPTVEIASPGGYHDHEVRHVRRIIEDNLGRMIRKWDDECARVDSEGKA